MIVLKTLSREFDIDPYLLRRMLRREFGIVKGRRWRWDESKDKNELKKIRAFLTKCSNGTIGVAQTARSNPSPGKK